MPGCSRKDEPLPVATPASGVANSPAGARAQAWFASLKNTTTSLKGSTASRTEGDAQPAINWEQAIYSAEYVVAPFADTDNPFAISQHYGYRFLVVRTTADSCTGRIVELIARQSIEPQKAAQLALAGAQPLLAGQAPGPVKDFTGSLLLYSPAYEYETGFAYEAGILQPLRMAPGSAGPDTCYDYYLVGYDNTGTQVIHEYLYSTGNCTGGVGGSGGSDGGWGGVGGSGNTGGGGGASQIKTINVGGLAPCQKQVMQSLQAASGTALLGIVKLFSGSEPGYNWVVRNGSLSTGTYGNTNSLYNSSTRSVSTVFDARHFSNASDIAIAQVMLHESIHAYLVAYFNNSPYAGAPNATFATMMATYQAGLQSGQVPGMNILHHDEMVQGGSGNGWIGDIAWALRQYGVQKGYNLSDQFYMDMAWAGLTDTAAFLALPAADRTRIWNTILTELTGKDTNANSAQQSGAPSGC